MSPQSPVEPLELEELLEDELELDEDDELLEEELEELLEELELEDVEPPIVVPQFLTMFFTNLPDAVRSSSLQLPKGLAPGTITEEPSSLSLTAQFR